MSVGTPSANAYFFDVATNNKAYEVYIDVTKFPDTTDFLDCRYREKNTNEEWQWLLSPDLYNMTDKTKTDVEFNKAINAINAKLKEVFNLDSSPIEPEKGVERIKWLLTNKLKWDGSNLLVVP